MKGSLIGNLTTGYQITKQVKTIIEVQNSNKLKND